MPIDINHFWDINYYFHPPLTEHVVRLAEDILGVRLPDSYVNLLRMQNGGYTQGFIFPMQQKTSWAEDHVPLHSLFGIVLDETIKSAQNIMDSPYLSDEWNLPPQQIIISGEGAWWITLDYRRGDNPSVMWIDTDVQEEIRIAENFDAFIDGIILENQ